MFIADGLPQFREKFALGLKNMLADGGLGAFILVLANSMQDQTLHQLLAADLQQAFASLRANCPDAPEDDQTVFSALARSGIDALGCWETSRMEPWELVINPLRSLRPARVSREVFESIQRPFDPTKFHFNKPFLRPEILWEGTWQGGQLRVLYNKFPFAPWHLLVVPEPEQTLPQFLTRSQHERMAQLVTEQAGHLPGLGMAFNSLGAYASINQLHFQGFVRKEPFPVESACWQHNGGTEPYPLTCYRTDAETAWQRIEDCHRCNQPYNLLYRADACYVILRKGQGSVPLPAWSEGIAWQEVCGVFTLANRRILATLDAGGISQQLMQLFSGTCIY
jgi:diadenosine tetraphosphate (Ap4A) HIT family hydrolase